MRTEAKDPALSLYCKQWTIEHGYELPWACGYSSLVTSMRLLGDRTIRADRLPDWVKRTGENPKDGIDSDQLKALANGYGYSVRSFPQKSKHDEFAFKEWLLDAWGRNHPTVVACGGYRANPNDHFVVAYSNPEDTWVWVMDPIEEDEAFSKMSWSDFLEWSGGEEKGKQVWEGHAISPKAAAPGAVPPSTELFEWINELPGDLSEQDYVAVAFVDNLLETLASFRAMAGRPSMPLQHVVADDGQLWEKFQLWSNYFDEDDLGVLGNMLRVAFDLDAYLDLRIDATRLEALAAELAFLCVNVLRYHGWLEEA